MNDNNGKWKDRYESDVRLIEYIKAAVVALVASVATVLFNLLFRGIL